MNKNLERGDFLKYLRKTMRIMRLSLFLIIISSAMAFSATSYSQNTKLTLNLNNATVKEVIKAIEDQSEFLFFYQEKHVDLNRKVTLHATEQEVETIMNQLFAETNNIYVINDRQIVIGVAPRRELEKQMLRLKGDIKTVIEQPQQKEITGKVTDSDGLPLPGVSIIVKGTTIGTVTNNDGLFSLNIPLNAETLQFSFVGMRTQEIPIDGRTTFTVLMEEETIGIDEVVAIGYGVQKKMDITGAVSSVNSSALEENPVTNISTVLRGRVAGLNVTSSGNKPGSTPTIRLRGNRSISASNDPLFVIDGIPVSGNINDFNIQDVTSIEILKDASATAIYGARGANGVIIVTTKKGKTGLTTISYDGYLSISEAFRKIPMMDGPKFTEYKREAYKASGRYTDDFAIFDPIELEVIESGDWTDWQDLLLQTGFAQNHSLSVNGGSDNTTFNISLNYLKDEGIIPLQDFTRYNARINFDHSFNKFRFGTSLIGTYSITNGGDENPYSYATQLIPLSRPYDKDGNLLLMTTAEASTYNPLTVVVPEQNVNRNKRYRIFGNIYGEIDISEGLKYRLNFGPDISQNRTGNYRGSYTPQRREGAATANLSERFELNYTLENILYYNRLFKEKHRLNLTGLYSIQSQQTESSGIDVLGVPIDAMQYHNIGSSESIEGLRSDFVKWSILSGMARLNYVFDERYLVTFTSRMDGSSRFGSNQKWGFFPSAAIGWNIHNENFMAHNELFDNLRLRISYGSTGNTAISPYQTMGRLSRTDYDFGGNPAFGYRPSSIRNDDLRWEKTTSFNIGIDFSIINRRLSGNVEFYSQNTSDLLLQRQLPPTSGFSSIIENIGKTQNNGIEAALSAIIIPKRTTNSFDWTIDFNFATNNENIIELFGGKMDDIGNQWFIGHPINVFFDYEKIGIWQKGEESSAESYGTKVGQIKIKDQNNDGVIDAKDRVILGTRTPKLNGGITNRFTYNNFDFSVFLYGAGGNMISSSLHTSRNTLFGRYNNLDVDYWTENNPTNKYPQPFSDQERPLYHTTMAYFDGWFIKCGNITLGYNLPSTFLNKFNSKSLRLYLTLQNPFIISPYVNDGEGIDPEFPTLSTPNTKSYLLGLNVSF